MIDKPETVEKTETTRPATSTSTPGQSATPVASRPAGSVAESRATRGGRPPEPSKSSAEGDHATSSASAESATEARDDGRGVGSLLSALGGLSTDHEPASGEENAARAPEPGRDTEDESPLVKTDLSEDLERMRQEVQDQQALDDLDRYGDVYDNPGGGDPDGIISTGDLEDIARGEYNREAARQRLVDLGVPEADVDKTLERLGRSAQYMLDHEELRNQVDVANDQGGDPDGDISRSDLSGEIFRRQLARSQQGVLPTGPAAANRDSYALVDASNAERTPEVIQAQELQVLEAVASGEPVSFTNANGQTEELTVRQLSNTGGTTVYELTGEDGHTIRIESELGASENRTALARVADYYTQLPPELRDAVPRIELCRKADETAAARCFRDDHHVTFYDGLEHLNEEVFNHEYAHAIGLKLDGLGDGVLHEIGQLVTGDDGMWMPPGWQEAVGSDGSRVSDYAGKSDVEDFAESWAAYMEARENGPEALKRYQEAYPARYAIIEKLYNEAMG